MALDYTPILVTFNDTYKSTKESWVTGFTGTSETEVALVIAVVPAFTFLNTVLLSFLTVSGWTAPVRKWSLTRRFLVEFVTIVLPALVALTIASTTPTPTTASTKHTLVHVQGEEGTTTTTTIVTLIAGIARTAASFSPVTLLSLSALLAAIILHITSVLRWKFPLLSISPTTTKGHAIYWLLGENETKKSFISSYRSGMMLCTVIAILAVDFAVFPRRYVKSETFGTSLMDMGVGAFVLSASLVSRQTRRVKCSGDIVAVIPDESVSNGSSSSSSSGSSKKRTSKSNNNNGGGCGGDSPRTQNSVGAIALKSMLETAVSVSPLLALGVIRLVFHTLINYQLHESEYGRHWNFFFTMASVALLATVVEIGWSVVAFAVSSLRQGKPTLLPRTLTAWLYFGAGITIAAVYQKMIMQPLPSSFIEANTHNSNYYHNDDNSSTLFPSSSSSSSSSAHLFIPVVHTGDGPDTFCKDLKTGQNLIGSSAGGDGRIETIQQFILCAPRTANSLVMQNREGIAGVLGFFAIYLCGVGLGVWLFTERKTVRDWRNFFLQASGACVSLWAGMRWASQESVAGPVSRRLVNAPYVLWVLAFNWTMLISLLGLEMVTVMYSEKETPMIAPSQEEELQEAGRGGGGEGMIRINSNNSSTEASSSLLDNTTDDANDNENMKNKKNDTNIHTLQSSSGKKRSGSKVSNRKNSATTSDNDESSSYSSASGSVSSSVSSGSGSNNNTTLRRRGTSSSKRGGGDNSSSTRNNSGQELDQQQDARKGSTTSSSFFKSITGFFLSRILQRPQPFPFHILAGGSVILDALNVNFLALFLGANILVGVVNLTTYTVHAETHVAMTILTVYIFTVCAVVTTWRRFGVTLKFW